MKTPVEIIQSLPFYDDVVSAKGKIYLVGGIVRDFFLKLESKDIDIIIAHIEINDLIHILQKHGNVDLIGKSFGILKFTNEQFDIDCCLPRAERKSGFGHKGFEIFSNPNLPIEQDLMRRDFTINSIAVDHEGNIYDPFDGLSDLNNGTIKMTNVLAFSDDPLRMLRGAIFSARFNFQISVQTLATINDNAQSIVDISRERILGELNKIIKYKKPTDGVIQLVKTRLAEHIFGFQDVVIVTDNLDLFMFSKTLSEFVYVYFKIHGKLHELLLWLKRDLKGDNKTYDLACALVESEKLTEDKIHNRHVVSRMYKLSPQILDVKILSNEFESVVKDFTELGYPKSVNELTVDGNDLIELGYKGKQIGDKQRELLNLVYSNKLKNSREELLKWIKK